MRLGIIEVRLILSNQQKSKMNRKQLLLILSTVFQVLQTKRRKITFCRYSMIKRTNPTLGIIKEEFKKQFEKKSIEESPDFGQINIEMQIVLDYKQQLYSGMEKYDKLKSNFRARTPENFKPMMKPFSLNFQKTPERFLNISPFVRDYEKDRKVIEIMKNSHTQYHSFFQFNQLFKDELNSPKRDKRKETNETEQNEEEFRRKGFQFFQYCANNPIEDSIKYFKIDELNAFVVSIFDGHGGPQLSKFCEANTPQYLQKYIRNGIKLHKYANNKIQLIKDALVQLHFQLQNQFYKQYLKLTSENKKCRGVGTCALTMVLYEKKCIIANCGDSQGMVISQNLGSYNFQKLSERFSVSNKSQRQRLIKQFNQIDEDIIVEERKNVFYLKGMLQPTKTIGDYYLKHKKHYVGEKDFKGPYLSCQPDVRVYDLQEHDKYMVVASDGLWDYLSKWEILKYIVESKNDKTCNAERETESETEDEKPQQFMATPEYLTQKILQKVANDFQIDIKYLKSLQLGERRSYHDDMTIGIIDIKDFFQPESFKD